MNRSKNIDKLYREGMANYSEAPPTYIWDSIESNLQASKKNKTAIIWWRSLAAAAITGLIFLSGIFWNNNNNENLVTENITSETKNSTILKNTEDSPNINSIVTKRSSKNPSTHQTLNTEHNALTEVSTFKPEVVSNNSKKEIISKSIHFANKEDNLNKLQSLPPNELNTNKPIDAQQIFHYRNNKLPDLKTSSELFFASNNINDENPEKAVRFALGGQFSPSYSYRESESKSTSAAKEDGLLSYTGGINLNFKTKKRWSVETGVYYSQVGQKFRNPTIGNNDIFSPSAEANGFEKNTDVDIPAKKPNLQNSMGEIKLNNSGESNLIQEMSDTYSDVRINSNERAYGQDDIEMIDIQQELNYIEVPFLVRYNIIDKSVGISISGGMSTNFLIGNNAYQLKNSNKERIGEMQNINDISYSAIFGIGIKTPVFKSIDFNFEPKVRYFLNSVTNNNGDYKPYSIGIYTGFSYNF